MSNPQPFTIDIPQSALDDLQRRLDNTRWPEAETVNDWSQGIPLAYTRELAHYWSNDYNWRERESLLNRFPQFTHTVDDLDIHFIHARSPQSDARPLLITHGWPGSIVEFHKVIGPLIDPAAHGGNADDAFHVVAPSLPGYGFSGKPAKTGCGVPRIAELWAKLMAALGYDRYYAQGGDWGAMVTTAIGIQDPGHCTGIHLNMPIVPPDPDTMENLTEQEQAALAGMDEYGKWDSGYSKQQSTRPQTLGYGLVDSPVGQMAWIVEKFWKWTDCNGHPENVLSKDELLDNVMLYWLNAAAASSARLYWESFNEPIVDPVNTAVACSIYPKEIFRTSERWARKHFGDKLKYFNTLDKGGHFAAFEQPQIFVDELRKAFRAIDG